MALYKYQTQVVKSVDTPGPGNINRNTLESGLVLTFEQLRVARVIQGMGGKLLMSSTRKPVMSPSTLWADRFSEWRLR